MSATPDSTSANPQQVIVELKQQLAKCTAERDEALAERDEALEQQTATAEVLQVINSSPGNLAPVFDAMLEKAMRLCEAAFGVLWTTDGKTFSAAGLRGVPPDYAEFVQGRSRKPEPETALGRLISGEPFVHVPDVTTRDISDEVVRKLVDLGGTRTLLAVPLRRDRALLGAFVIYRQEVRPFSEKQIALLQNFAAQAVIAMENARLNTETREALDQQTATAEVLQVINSSPGNLGPVFDAMLEKALRLCNASRGHVWGYDGEGLTPLAIRGGAEVGEWFRQVGRLIPSPETPVGRVVQGEDLVHIGDVTKERAYTSLPLFRHYVDAGHLRTLLAVPLRQGGTLFGIFAVYRQEVQPFTEKQIALLKNFAAQAVIAMENARLLSETREALEQQTATAEVLQVINASPGDLAPVFEVILENAMRLCEAAFGMLGTVDGNKLCTVAERGLPQAYMEFRKNNPPVPGPARARILAGERVVHILDLRNEEFYRTNDSERRPVVDLGGARTVLLVALEKDGAVLGHIGVYRKEVQPFSEKQIALLQNFAAQAVIAIENARLLGELRQRTKEIGKLNRDLEARVAEQVDELGRVGRLKRFLAPQLAEMIVSQGDEKILESHRREIVVVFCDLRGYTAFTETAEPEEVLDFLREYHGALGPLVSQFEGTLDQFSGDGIMVFFNDPVPIPDPAERAVKMAVAMREAAGTLTVTWRRRGRMLGFGAGIAQGYATLGQIGFADRSGYTAIGTVCNLAARLCAAAKDGQILVAQRVAVAVEETVPLEEVGELTVKGLTQPVVAYNVPLAAIQPALRVIEGGSPQTV